MNLTQGALAKHIGCDVRVINRIINGWIAVTAEMALKLGNVFGNTADFWLNDQKAVDLYKASKKIGKLRRPIAA